MEPEWSDFKVLLALAGAGSVAGAARTLQVDNSTVSRRLAALEAALGTTLLIRGGREFSWTTAGRHALEAAEAMDRAVLQAAQAARSAKEDMKGRVRVAVSPAFVPLLMRLMVPALAEAHPDLEVELLGHYQRLDLARGEADLAVRMAQPVDPGLIGRLALKVGWFVYAAPAYLQARGRPATPEDLSRHRLVLYIEAMHNVPPLRWMEDYRGTGSTHTRVDNLEVAAQTAAAGGGLAVLPSLIGDLAPDLQRAFDTPVAVNDGWVVYHESVRGSARVRVVADALVDCFARHEALFSGLAGRSAT